MGPDFGVRARTPQGAGGLTSGSGNLTLDEVVTVGGIIYGLVLTVVPFVRNRFTEAMRIDALLTPRPTEATRLLNLVAGLLLVGYSGYSLLG